MATVCTLDGLNLNDGLLYFLQLGFDPGEEGLSFDEFPSYTGTMAVRNESRAKVIVATLPVDIRAANEAALKNAAAAINTKIGGCSYATPKVLNVAGDTFQIVASPRIRLVRDDLYALNIARLSIALNRLP
jgi:hypothetical protein